MYAKILQKMYIKLADKYRDGGASNGTARDKFSNTDRATAYEHPHPRTPCLGLPEFVQRVLPPLLRLALRLRLLLLAV